MAEGPDRPAGRSPAAEPPVDTRPFRRTPRRPATRSRSVDRRSPATRCSQECRCHRRPRHCRPAGIPLRRPRTRPPTRDTRSSPVIRRRGIPPVGYGRSPRRRSRSRRAATAGVVKAARCWRTSRAGFSCRRIGLLSSSTTFSDFGVRTGTRHRDDVSMRGAARRRAADRRRGPGLQPQAGPDDRRCRDLAGLVGLVDHPVRVLRADPGLVVAARRAAGAVHVADDRRRRARPGRRAADLVPSVQELSVGCFNAPLAISRWSTSAVSGAAP